jgi:hypothetical protein
MSIEGRAGSAQKVRELIRRVGRALAIPVTPTEAQDAGHGDNERVLHLGACDGWWELDIVGWEGSVLVGHGTGSLAPAARAQVSRSSSSWTSVGWT